VIREELVFVATCDISGHVRGKGFPARELKARVRRGVGWTGSNLMMSPQGPTWDTPFGTAGDLDLAKPAQHFCAGVLHHMPAICAGVDGIRRALPLPAPGGTVAALPQSLTAALDNLAADTTVGGWFGQTHLDAYLRFKRVEAEKVAGLAEAELCAHYAEIY
jgi:glutamine synthetase